MRAYDNIWDSLRAYNNMGVWFDSDFSFSKHIQNVCKSCFIQLRDFRSIRQFLTHDAAVSVANVLLVVGWTTELIFQESLQIQSSQITVYPK